MAVTFDDIFPEYFTLYRGQATNIPGSSDPEYQIALKLANNSVKKWSRTDGVEWNNMWRNFSDGGIVPLLDGVLTYEVTNMRKPPKQVLIGGSPLPVIDPAQVDLVSQNVAWFTGSPTRGFTLHLKRHTAEQVGQDIDFIYLANPEAITSGTSVIDVPDENYVIHDMLAARFTNARNGFAVKVHKAEAMTALQNMKIDNNTGTYGRSDNLGSQGAGFGVTRNASII